LNENLPAPHHALGFLADRLGQTGVAAVHYREALKVDPGFAPSRANLGRIDYQRGLFDEAREQFERLTEVAPESVQGWVGLTESLLRLGREDDADAVLSRARAKLGDVPELRLLVARQLLRRGAFAAAEEVLAPLTDDPERGPRAAAWSWISVARVGEGKRDEAVQAAREALLADSSSALASHALRVALSAGERTP
jgi:tetratricopeptide (TPR) repeat protein